ncbi:MAG TPA: TPM domain-containing protein [Chitinophagaceae bacterium]
MSNSVRLLLVLVCLAIFQNLPAQATRKDYVPLRVGYVNDFIRIYTTEEDEILDSMIVSFEKRTSIQIAIITVDTSIVDQQDFDNWTLRVARKWGIGQKDKNNGVLIAICPGYRRMRIQNGYGIEKILSDQETQQIADNDFIPFFKEAKFFNGTKNGLEVLFKKLDKSSL